MLKDYIAEKKKNKDILLMTHVICGYPSFEDNWKELEIMDEFGVDFVELQFPFSEPSADGPHFVRANELSLQNGTTVDQCFEFMKKVTEKFSFKTLMMGYYNTAYKMGHEKYIARLKDAGGCAYILPDLPLEEAGELHALSKANDIEPIMLMTPTNTDERLAQIAEVASGLIYVVARKGVTGGKTDMSTEVGNYLDRCRKVTDLPLGVGFGVSSKADLDFLRSQNADCAIIGTAVLKVWETDGEQGLRDFFTNLLK